jgi:hypothetical protein
LQLLGVRNAADAARDMQLWAEFEALQRQHGEALCGAILRSCDHDFVEAVATIKAQAAGFGSSSSSAAGISAAAPAAGQQPAAAAGPDDDLVVQLALSLDLPAESALALCRLVPHVAPEAAVEALQQHSGDANKAADALLAADADAASAAAAVAIAAADERAAACVEAAHEPAGYGSGGLSPAERVAASFARSRDPDLVVSARSLCSMFDWLQQDVAELVLQEHGGSFEQVGGGGRVLILGGLPGCTRATCLLCDDWCWMLLESCVYKASVSGALHTCKQADAVHGFVVLAMLAGRCRCVCKMRLNSA